MLFWQHNGKFLELRVSLTEIKTSSHTKGLGVLLFRHN